MLPSLDLVWLFVLVFVDCLCGICGLLIDVFDEAEWKLNCSLFCFSVLESVNLRLCFLFFC